jgi:hypothetical protein
MESGAEKRFLTSHFHKLSIVEDVPREGRDGQFLERISRPRPTECEVCGKELTDLVSVAIGVGPHCRCLTLGAQRARIGEQLSSSLEKLCSGDQEAASAAVDEMMNDEERARFLIWIYELAV